MTQQNTAKAEEMAASARELAGHANGLAAQLTRFKLAQGTGMAGLEGLDPHTLEALHALLAQQGVALPDLVRQTGPRPSRPALVGDGAPRRGRNVPRDGILSLNDDEFGDF